MNEHVDSSSATGVDLRLDIAGPGARSYAFVIDWHIRLLLALAWLIVASFPLFGGIGAVRTDDANFQTYVLVVLLPALAIYLLYHPVLEIAMRGRTPGKRMAGVRITTLDGQVPGVLAHLVRNLLRLLDSLPAAYAVGLTVALLTRNSVRIGDLAAGTVLVYDTDARGGSPLAAPVSASAISRLGLEEAELCRDLLDRWEFLEDDARRELAARLLRRLAPTATPGAASGALREQLAALLEEGSGD